jgi:hypothetical protein
LPKEKAIEETEIEMTAMATAETDLAEVEVEEEKLHALWSATSAASEAISLEIVVDATGIDVAVTETATGIDETEAEIEVEIETVAEIETGVVIEIAVALETAEVRETEIVAAQEIDDPIEAEIEAGTNLVIDPVIEAVKRREDLRKSVGQEARQLTVVQDLNQDQPVLTGLKKETARTITITVTRTVSVITIQPTTSTWNKKFLHQLYILIRINDYYNLILDIYKYYIFKYIIYK